MIVKNHPIESVYFTYSQIKNKIYPLLMLILGLISSSSHYKPYILTAFLLYILFIIWTAGLNWYTTTGTFDENTLHYRSGYFVKKEQIIPYENIKSLSLETTLLRSRFGLQTVTFEIVGKDSVQFTISMRQFHGIEKLIHHKINAVERTEVKPKRFQLNRFSFVEYCILTVSSWKWMLVGISTAWSVLGFIANMYNRWKPDKNSSSGGIKDLKTTSLELLKMLQNPSSIMTIGVAILFYLLVSLIIAFVICTLYHAFYERKVSESVWSVRQGIYKVKEIHVREHQIRSIVIRENGFTRIFKKVSLSLETLGTNNTSGEVLIIEPLFSKHNLNDYLRDHFPTFILQDQHITSRSTSYSWRSGLFYMSSWVFCIEVVRWLSVAVLDINLFQYVHLILLVLVIIFYQTFYRRKENQLTFSDTISVIRKTNIFQTTTRFVPMEHLQSFEIKSSYWQRQNATGDVRVSIFSDKAEETYKIPNLEEKHNELLYTFWKNKK
ncbi:PH domain-containing protein [Bacillus sp. AFS017336]|uniref:PH domain-containing protein n=1 Tax=Bacillus sp. AFS017336 TaxID=2033489 RepID=UPI000BEF9C69|nr:PH domain-containing protein [Bacillus sp. AFS017336]PEL14290.1 hypothetical protein CN601_01735 [Bacillus sp. AFS017336]